MGQQFNKYKDPVKSSDRLLERIGIITQGRYQGFDKMIQGATISGSISISLEHNPGISFLDPASSHSIKAGIAVTPQGTIIHETDPIDPPSLALDYNQTDNPRIDLVVMEHVYKADIPGDNPPTYLIISGTAAQGPTPPALTNPKTQVILGQIYVPSHTTSFTTSLGYTPAEKAEFAGDHRLAEATTKLKHVALTSQLDPGNPDINYYKDIANVYALGACTYTAPDQSITISGKGNIYVLPDTNTDRTIKNIFVQSTLIHSFFEIILVNNTPSTYRFVKGGNIQMMDNIEDGEGYHLKGLGSIMAFSYNNRKWSPKHNYLLSLVGDLLTLSKQFVKKDQLYTRAEADKIHQDMIAQLMQWVTDNFTAKGTVTPIPPDIKIFASDTSLDDFTRNGGDKTVTITINGGTTNTWELESKPDWITTDKSNGNSGDTVTVTASQNSTSTKRTGAIIFRSTEDTTKTISVSVAQIGTQITINADPSYHSVLSSPSLTIIQSIINVTGSSQGWHIQEINWVEGIGENWLSAYVDSSASGGTLTIHMDKVNTLDSIRIAHIIVASNEDTSVQDTITVAQEPNEFIQGVPS